MRLPVSTFRVSSRRVHLQRRESGWQRKRYYRIPGWKIKRLAAKRAGVGFLSFLRKRYYRIPGWKIKRLAAKRAGVGFLSFLRKRYYRIPGWKIKRLAAKRAGVGFLSFLAYFQFHRTYAKLIIIEGFSISRRM